MDGGLTMITQPQQPAAAALSLRELDDSLAKWLASDFAASGLRGDDLWRELDLWLTEALARDTELYDPENDASERELNAHADDLNFLQFVFRVTPARTRFGLQVKARAAKAGFY